MDAKYRDLWERSLPNHMLYQLTIYATTHPQHVATILYPTVERQATESRVAIRDRSTEPTSARCSCGLLCYRPWKHSLMNGARGRNRRMPTGWLSVSDLRNVS